eukprot:334229_1
MTLNYSNIISITYFSCYSLFLFILGYIVYKQGGHETIKSKSYIKDVWAQRKIYGPLLVYFYDTASDIGVLVFWYQLMTEEQNGLRDYNSVNMTLYFWLGISFMILYRVVMVLWTTWAFCDGDDDDYAGYDAILVIFDLYIFKVVYNSFTEARETISNNAKKRQKKQETKKKKETKIQMEIEMASVNTQAVTDPDENDVEEIAPSAPQEMAQIFESIFESMPQIILQSIFVIRSANDEVLKSASSNDILIMVSIIASLISIANKYIAVADVDSVVDKAKSLKPRQECPGCIQYWYIIRLLWRIFDIMSSFVVYVLIWGVMGGAWLPIWFVLIYIMWVIVYYVLRDDELPKSMVSGIVCSVGMFMFESVIPHFCKYMETIIGLIIITIFTLIEFDCWQCSDAKERQMTSNNRIMIFVIMGWISLVGEMTLYAVMRSNEIVVEWY